VLYVELDKDPKHYTPTTLYDDRIISPTLFQAAPPQKRQW
jgi:hypothetical protein